MPGKRYAELRIDTLYERLHLLEMQESTLGIHTPPHVVMEIEKLKKQIKKEETASRNIITVEMLENMLPAEQWKRLYDATWELEVYFHSLEKDVSGMANHMQARHKEFNEKLLQSTFEIEQLKRSNNRLYIALVATALLCFAAIYIQSLIN